MGFSLLPREDEYFVLFSQVTEKIQEAYPEHAIAVIHLAQQFPPWAIHDFVVCDCAFYLYRFMLRNVTDRVKMSFILVTQWQMQHEIELVGNT